MAPTRGGIATSPKSCAAVKSNPMAGNKAATMLKSCHTAKPRNSAKIEKTRLRHATYLPLLSQNSLSSGSHSSIQLPVLLACPAVVLATYRTPFESPFRRRLLPPSPESSCLQDQAAC